MHAYGKGKPNSTKSKIVRGVGKIKIVFLYRGEGRKYVVTTNIYICDELLNQYKNFFNIFLQHIIINTQRLNITNERKE